MTTYYRILRPVTRADLDAPPSIAQILRMIPPDGQVTFGHFKDAGENRTQKGLMYACSHGILERILPHEKISELESVKFWCTQLNEPGYKNSRPRYNTRQIYLRGLSKFDAWLPGRTFPSYETVMNDGQITRKAVTKSFENVEELLTYCNESNYGVKTAQRAVREYLASSQMSAVSASAHAGMRSAIRSYFNTNDVVLVLPKTRKKRSEPVSDEDSHMTLDDFYMMLHNGNPSVMMRTIMLIKLQSGMDSSTFADRFNHEGYSQIVKYFGTDNHKTWSLDMCPVPIKLVRVKTNVQYTTFIDRDAVAQLQRYLTWKETARGKHDPSKPLFMTKHNTPIHSIWLSSGFSDVAVRAGVQKKVSHMVYKIRAHEVRQLLKSTLMANGCAQYAADHVLGHAPRDSYEKQAVLYPEKLRAEYAKASQFINVFSKMSNSLNITNDPASLQASIREIKAELSESKQSKTESDIMDGTHKNALKDMHDEIKRLASILDALPDNIKEQVADKLKRSVNTE